MQAFLHFLSLFALTGLGPVVAFSGFLAPRSFWSFAALSIALGAIFFNLTVLTAGHLGLHILGANLQALSCGAVTASIIVCALACIRKGVRARLSGAALISGIKGELRKIDLLATLILGSYFVFLFWVCLVHYFPAWDVFTYWLIDARQIFNTGALRSNTNVTNLFLSTSYHPLHAAYIFDWYGEPREQWASLFPILYASLSTFFCYSVFGRPEGLARLWLILALLWVNFSVQFQALTFYADVHVAFFFTLFFYLLLKECDGSKLGQRIFLLGLVLTGLCCIKSANYVYAGVLTVVWFIYDWPLIKFNWRNISNQKLAFGGLALITAGYCARLYYLGSVWKSKIVPEPLLEPSKLDFAFYNRLLHGEAVVDLVTGEYSVIYLIFFGVVFDLLLRSKLSRPGLLIVCCGFLLPFLNMLEYMYSLNSLQSKSLTRYVLTVFWVIPMYLAIAQPWLQPEAVKRIVVSVATVVTFIIIGVFDYNQFIQPAGEFHNGAFKDFKFHKEDYDISRRVLERIGKESVLLANNEGGAFVGNMGLPSLQLRYYLASNTVGGLYNTAKLEFKKKLRQIKPEYVLVTEWNDELIRLFNPSNSTKMGLFRKISASPPHFAEVSF